jgi:hypothetical protein
MSGEIISIKTSDDKKHLFINDSDGWWKHINVQNQKAMDGDVGTGQSGICEIVTTPDNQYVFTGSGAWLQQYSIDAQEFINPKKTNFDQTITSIVTTFDSKYVFIGLQNGALHQLCVDSQESVYSYGCMGTPTVWGSGDKSIGSMAVTKDNSYLFITTGYYLKKISVATFHFRNFKYITNQELVQDFGKIC